MYPPIQNLRAFVAVANTGQFRIAAEQTGVSESAVSHQISRLEAQLGVQLLERNRNGAKLTEIGKAFYVQISAGLYEIDAALQTVKREKSNIVTISAPQTLSSLWLAPNLVSFYDANPSVELRIIATDRVCDLKTEGIDFALRRGTNIWPEHNQELFCMEEIYPVASRDLYLKIDAMGWEETLKSTPMILNEAHLDEWDRWSAETGVGIPARTRFLRFSSYDQVQAAVINGLGIGMARAPLHLEALSDGRLHRVNLRGCQTQTYRLIWTLGRQMPAAQRLFLKWLRSMKPTQTATDT